MKEDKHEMHELTQDLVIGKETVIFGAITIPIYLISRRAFLAVSPPGVSPAIAIYVKEMNTREECPE